MKNTGYMNGESEQGEDINLIVTKVCDFYLKEINSSIVDLNQQKPQKSRDVLQYSKMHFQRIKKLLTFINSGAEDAQKIEEVSEKLKNFEKILQDHIQEVFKLPLELERNHRIPDLRPEIASYVLNTGNYHLFQPCIHGVRNFGLKLQDIYDHAQQLLQRKLILSEIPKENISLNIEDGVLKVETATITFEIMVFWQPDLSIHKLTLMGFQHKLLDIPNYQDALYKIQVEIDGIYKNKDTIKELEPYIIVFTLYRIKAVYSRLKLQTMMDQAQNLINQIHKLNTQEEFSITKFPSGDNLYYEITYWDKTSLLQYLKPDNSLVIFFAMDVKTLNFSSFVELYKKDPYTTMYGIGDEDIVKLKHDPPIISQEAIISLYNCLRETQHQVVIFKKFQEILCFGTSPRVRLGGFSINNSFIELFTEIKRMFSIQQIIYYYSFLYQRVNALDLQNIKLIYRNDRELHNNQSLIKQRDIKIAIQVENQTFVLFIDQKTGMLDISTDNAPKLIEINKGKFKKILTNNSGDFGQLMILYKKLLFLNSCGKLLDTHNLRSSKDSDGLKSIEMRSQLIQFMKSADTNSRHLIEVTLSYELIFDDNLERIDVEVNTKFQNTNLNNRVDIIPAKFSISTNPFDLKKILKQLDEEIRKTRAGAYFDLELKLSYKEEELNDKPLPRLGSSWKQKREVLDNHTQITLSPGDPLLNDLKNYLKDKEGVKLMYSQNSPKSMEKIEKTKLTIKYDSTLEGYKCMQKDIERLEAFLRQQNFSKTLDTYRVQEYHSTSFHYLLENNVEKVMFRFVGNKLAEILPSKFQNLRLFIEDKDTIANKELFIRLMIQAYSVMMTSLLFTDNKEVWFYADRQHPKQDMFIHIMLIDPFRFMFVFRNIFKPQGGSYFMNFQIQGDECELISVYREEAYKYPLVPYTNHDALIVEAGFQKKFPMAKLKEFGAKISARIKGHTRVPQVQPNIRPPPQ